MHRECLFFQSEHGILGKWIDGRLWDHKTFPLSSNGLVKQSTCTHNNVCSFPTIRSLSKKDCAAHRVNKGFSDLTITPVDCTTSYQMVALYCFHREHRQSRLLQNELSDIKVIPLKNGFHRLEFLHSCPEHWFRIDDLCINLFRCSKYGCQLEADADAECQNNNAVLANKVFANVSFINKTFYTGTYLVADNTSTLAKFWFMFYQSKLHDTEVFYDPFDYWHLTIAFNSSSVCHLRQEDPCSGAVIDIHVSKGLYTYVLTPWKQQWYAALWSLVSEPRIKWLKPVPKEYVMCEMDKDSSHLVSNCSVQYMSCNDGTCIHDSLLCDGQNHCVDSKDENNCRHVCSHSNNINCYTDCHIDDLCTCSDSYFHCLSGGCIPLHRLCDQTPHCADSSDEPPTCVYLRPDNIHPPSMSLPANSYINRLINASNSYHQHCSRHITFRPIKPVNYKMVYTSYNTCPESFPPSQLMIICSDWQHYSHREKIQSIPLSHLCVYDNECDQVSFCRNGFHLLKCEYMCCRGQFKCRSSYCVQHHRVCNKVCDCPQCEDESFCRKISCPGMLLVERISKGLQCIDEADIPNPYQRQLIQKPGFNISDEFPVYVDIRSGSHLQSMIFSPELVAYLNITHCKLDIDDFEVIFRMVSIRSLDLSNNNINEINFGIFSSMSQLIFLDISSNKISSVSKSLLCFCL